MTARATYLAGTWVAIAAAIDDVLDALVAAGIRSAPSFAIARTSSDEHRVVVRGDVRVVVDPTSASLLAGATLDFKDGLQGAGFSINNPNATRSCGCGQSFS